jgi:hypothetical protein
MSTKIMMVMGLLTVGLATAASAFAEDGVIHQDQQRIEQDKQDIRQDKANIRLANEKIQQDKASGDLAQLDKDRVAKREAVRNKREAERRLREDRSAKRHDERNV